MSEKSFIEQSKLGWVPAAGYIPNDTQLAIGCLQRIASSLESLNRSWCGIQEQNVRFRERVSSLERSNARLRGEITRLKKKAAQ